MEFNNKMYTTLFNGIIDARKKLSDLNDFLSSLQQQTEEMYISEENEEN